MTRMSKWRSKLNHFAKCGISAGKYPFCEGRDLSYLCVEADYVVDLSAAYRTTSIVAVDGACTDKAPEMMKTLNLQCRTSRINV